MASRRSVGSVTIAASAVWGSDQRLGPGARVLLVGDGRHQQSPSREAPAARNRARRVNHGRDAALHVLAAAPVDAAVAHDGVERRGHSLDAHRVHVAADHQRPTRRAPLDGRDDVRSPGSDLGHLDVESGPRERRRDALRDGGLAGAPGHERRVDGIDRDQVAQQLNDGVSTDCAPRA